jgi:hypothetical protein
VRPACKGKRGLPGLDGAVGAQGPRGERGERGPAGPQGEQGAPGKLPICKRWSEGVHYAGEVVSHDGGTYQATKDTAQIPGTGNDWIRLARPGRDAITPEVRGTFDDKAKYQHLDIVALNGSSFVARRDDPGSCPGDGWQLLASAGKGGGRGEQGPRGETGPQGPQGERGVGGDAAQTIVGWTVDPERYSILPVLADGKKGPPIELYKLFKQFALEAR